MKKRVVSILLSLCIILTMLPTTVEAEDYKDFNVKDTIKWSLKTLDGERIDENTYKDKLRFYVFVLHDCPNSQGAVKYISNSDWITNKDVQVVVIFDDKSTMEQKKKFIETYASNNKNIVFAYVDKMGEILLKYTKLIGFKDALYYSNGIIIDQNNKIRRAIANCDYYAAASFYGSAINELLYKLKPEDTFTFDVNGTFDYDEANEVLGLLNELRATKGVKPLKLDKDLMDTAMQRAAEISIYYSHTRPNGKDPYTIFPKNNKYIGENIAAGQVTAKEVMTGWTNSPGHYKNMVEGNFDAVGIGCFYQDNGTKYWAQVFSGGRKTTAGESSGKKDKNAEITALGSNLDIEISAASSDISIGDTQKYDLVNTNTGFPDLGTTRIVPKVYSSSDATVATVDSTGLVTGIKGGNAWIKLGISNDTYWKKAVKVDSGYLISFDANGGTGAPAPQAKPKNRPLKLTSVTPTREGYTFGGWITDLKAKNPTYKSGDTIPENVNKDMELYALWNMAYCFVNFDLQGGTGPLYTQVIQYGAPTKLTTLTPKKNGYKFLGWSTVKDAKAPEYLPGDTLTFKQDKITFYALWGK